MSPGLRARAASPRRRSGARTARHRRNRCLRAPPRLLPVPAPAARRAGYCLLQLPCSISTIAMYRSTPTNAALGVPLHELLPPLVAQPAHAVVGVIRADHAIRLRDFTVRAAAEVDPLDLRYGREPLVAALHDLEV